jgi:hypothetical protein
MSQPSSMAFYAWAKLAGSQSSIGRELKIHQIYDADVTKNCRYYHSLTSRVKNYGLLLVNKARYTRKTK